MKPIFSLAVCALALFSAMSHAQNQAQTHLHNAPLDPNCLTGECAPLISLVEWEKREAYKLTDGKSEVVIVPSLGRVMRFGWVGGPNLLWAGQNVKPKAGEWGNWGGDKSWPAPQSDWSVWQKSGNWPPPLEWDGSPHTAEVLTGGKLKTLSPIHAGLGARVTRTYGFNAQGELEIEQAMEKFSGPPRMHSIWSVTQIPQPDALFLSTNANSPYKNGFHFIAHDASKTVNWTTLAPNLLRVQPALDSSFKIGTDAPVIAIAAVKGDTALVQRAATIQGDYPDGALGAGFGLEMYNNPGPTAYNELEILSPLRLYRASANGKTVGTRWKHTVRWSLHRLPSNDAQSNETAQAIAQIFGGKVSAAST